MKANFSFPFLSWPSLTWLLTLLLSQVASAQYVITEMAPTPPKTHTTVRIVEQPYSALRTDGGAEPVRIYSIQPGETAPVVLQQKRTTSVTTGDTKPKKKVETASVEKKTQSTKAKRPVLSRKPLLTKARETPKPNKHVVEHKEITKRRTAPTILTQEKTVTAVQRSPATEITRVDSGAIDALVIPTDGASPQWNRSHITTVSVEPPQPSVSLKRETKTIQVRSEPRELSVAAPATQEEVIDPHLFPADSPETKPEPRSSAQP